MAADRFKFDAGAMKCTTDTTVVIAKTALPKAPLDQKFSKDGGLSSSQTFRERLVRAPAHVSSKEVDCGMKAGDCTITVARNS